MITVTARTPIATENPCSPRAFEKYRPAAPVSPTSFDSQPRRDAISALSGGWRPLVGLAIGDDRALEVARAHLRRGDVAPGKVRRRVVGQARGLLPGLEGLPVVVEPVERLAEADHRRSGDGDVVEADDALVQPGRVDEVGRGHQRGRVIERRERRLA